MAPAESEHGDIQSRNGVQQVTGVAQGFTTAINRSAAAKRIDAATIFTPFPV
jgi:hypothetical protein